ncbi:conserved Plasmodium protein, unknown function [Plasmodium berghei]|uniref:Cyclin-dependent kinases regulatory subunit n=1 Tax=Plasmodium berghei TaxID=5821 RepID=A0A1D3LTH3_PLABE|nr:conserved Plasmodium protein, unknown function [Plasmodium berghei]
MPIDNNCFYNINLSIHKIFNPRYSAPNKINDENKPANKKRRCTVSHINERNVTQKYNNDYLNYNFNNSITKRRKCSPNLAYPNKKYSPLLNRRELRNSINQSIKKSEVLRSIVSETIEKKKTETCGNKDNESFYNINKKTYYLSRYSGDNNSNGIENVKDIQDKKYIKLYLYENKQGNNQIGSTVNLNESFIMSNLAQSENCFRNKNMDSLNTFRENIPIYVNSQSTFSSFNFDREIENKYVKKILQDNCQTIDNEQFKQTEKHNMMENSCRIKNKYSYITDMNHIEKQELDDDNNNNNNNNNDEKIKKNKYISINSNNNRNMISSNHNDKSNRNTITNSLKRRHSIQFEKEHEKYNYSDSIYVNKRFKENDKNNKSSTRRHSDVINSNSINGIYMNNMKNSANFQNNMYPNMGKYNASNNSHNFKNIDANKNTQEQNEKKPWFKNCFLKNDGIFDNHQGIRKKKVDNTNSNGNDENSLKNDAEYLFSTDFFKDVYSNIQRKGELNFIDELLEKDTEYYISKSKLNKIVENAKNKETKYHYIDRLFLYRHAKHVVGDKEYEAYKNKCRSKQKYLDVPFPNLSEIMNLHPISDLDEIDDSDEFYGAEVKLLEDFYSNTSKTKQNNKICTFFDKKNDIENKIIIKKRHPISKPNNDLYVLGTREKLINLMNKFKREKDSFFEKILDAPDFSKLLEPVHSVNESFLLSHQLFNLQHAAQFGPVVYLIKTEDEKYIYRAIEVSKLYEDKVKSILDNKKHNSDSKERNDGYDCYSNERYPFLHELDVKYYLKIPMSTGWNHFCYLKNQHNVLFFRRLKNPSSLQ